MQNFRDENKAIGPVVAIALLLITAVVGVVGFQSWYNDFSSQVLSNTETQSSNSVSQTGIDTLVSGELFFNNAGSNNITIAKIKVGNTECEVNQNLSSGVSEIELCDGTYSSGEQEVVVYTNDKIYSKKFFSSLDFTVDSCLTNGTNGFNGGDGSSGDPYEICNCNQLQAMNQSLTSYYELVRNVDCSETSTWNSGQGFDPVGGFTGSFEGNSYTISNLVSNRSEDNVAIFSSVTSAPLQNVILDGFIIEGNSQVGTLVGSISSSSSSVENVTVRNSRVHGNNFNTGGVIGQTNGVNITNVIVDGTSVTSEGSATGGAVGYLLLDSIMTSSTVRNSNISTTAYSSGGITGLLFANSIIQNSSVYNVRITGVGNIGGIAAYVQPGIIRNSFSDNIIINGTNQNNGGIAGRFNGGTINNTYVKNSQIIASSSYQGAVVGQIFASSNLSNSFSFNTNVSANSFVGGITGGSAGLIFSSYWDNETVNFTGTDTTDSGEGSAQTTSALQTPTTNSGIYANWSTSVWDFGDSSSYPSLVWE